MCSVESPQRRPSRPIGIILRPECVTEKSFMESMAGFIHEVVPQAYGGSHGPSESNDPILWAKIESIDTGNCMSQSFSTHKTNLPLLLILGYATGVQIWTVLASGEAQEVMSWNTGPVKIFRLLPSPVFSGVQDLFATKRPLAAMCDGSGNSTQLYPVTFVSLRTGEQVKTIRFKNPIADIVANQRVVVVTFPEKIAVFSNATLEDTAVLTHCYPPGSGVCSNPIALGSRWLAYAEKRLLSIHRCGGGFEGEGIQSYTATVIHAAKSLTKGLREFGETFLTGQRSSSMPSSTSQQGPQPGVVTVIDLEGVSRGEVNLREDVDGVIAHFVAHANQAVSYLAFDPSGTLLFTADRQGHDFHIFRLHPAPCGTRHNAVHHLYTLHRGDTTAKVQAVAFATDSRWVAVTTMRGTTHVFPISPYGGSVGVRTHTSQRVVNRLSRFQRSAGLDDTPFPDRSSPVLSGSPSNGRQMESSTPMPYPNPRLPPYPHPTTVSPLVQLRSPFMSTSAVGRAIPSGPTLSGGRKLSESDDASASLRVTCCFAPPRGAPQLPGHGLSAAGSATHRDRLQRRMAESLYVMSCHGTLIEYALEPRLAAGIPREKACDKSSIELDIVSCAQWPIHRPLYNASDLPPPLAPSILSLITNGPDVELKDESPSSSIPLVGKEAQEPWLAQVEINTHAGPHRRLWMGPQFSFKTLKQNNNSSLAEIEASDVDILTRPGRSNPVNMPDAIDMPIQDLPVITGEGSASNSISGSYEQSPRLLATYGRDRVARRCDSESSISDMVPKVEVELQLKENLADAMIEMPSSGNNVPDDGSDRRTHYFMEDDRGHLQTSMTSSNPPTSLNNDEDLLDFELESETCLRPPPLHPKYVIDAMNRHVNPKDQTESLSADKDYSFFANDDMVSGVPVDVAFFPDASRSAGESSSAEEDVVAVAASDLDGSRGDRKNRKNRKKKK